MSKKLAEMKFELRRYSKELQLVLACLIHGMCFSQNLVPNPSFEEHEDCPSGGDLVTLSTHWWDWVQSPDYYCTCSLGSQVGVPLNEFGFQYPSSGECYIGLITYYSLKSSYREFVATKLTEPLEVGETYAISFKVAATVQPNPESGIAHLFSNNIGLKFYTEIQDTSISAIALPNSADLYSFEILSDTLQWVTLNTEIVAEEPHEYIALGNFFANDLTDTTQTETDLNFAAYVFIDDICVHRSSSECTNINSISDISIRIGLFPNPADEFVQFDFGRAVGQGQIEIFDIFGRVVYDSPALNLNGRLNTSMLTDGIYIVVYSMPNMRINKVLIVQHN